MTAFSPAPKVVDQIVGLNLNHRKCCWVQYRSESCESRFEWAATNCEEFLELNLYPHRTKQPAMMRPVPYSAFLQAHTMLFPRTYFVLAPCAAFAHLPTAWENSGSSRV